MSLLWIDRPEPNAALLGKALGVVLLATVAMFFVRLYQERMSFRRKMKEYDVVSSNLRRQKDPKPNRLAACAASLVSVWSPHPRGKGAGNLPERLVRLLSPGCICSSHPLTEFHKVPSSPFQSLYRKHTLKYALMVWSTSTPGHSVGRHFAYSTQTLQASSRRTFHFPRLPRWPGRSYPLPICMICSRWRARSGNSGGVFSTRVSRPRI